VFPKTLWGSFGLMGAVWAWMWFGTLRWSVTMNPVIQKTIPPALKDLIDSGRLGVKEGERFLRLCRSGILQDGFLEPEKIGPKVEPRNGSQTFLTCAQKGSPFQDRGGDPGIEDEWTPCPLMSQ